MRNTAAGIVQLSYGDDGLDPLLMEGRDKGRPLNFEHCLEVVRATSPRAEEEEALLPGEVMGVVDQQMTELGAWQRGDGGVMHGRRTLKWLLSPCCWAVVTSCSAYLGCGHWYFALHMCRHVVLDCIPPSFS